MDTTRFTVISPCSTLSPAIAKTSPSRYSWRSPAARSSSKYSSTLTTGIGLGRPIEFSTSASSIAQLYLPRHRLRQLPRGVTEQTLVFRAGRFQADLDLVGVVLGDLG